MAKELHKAGAPACHWLHFLQLAGDGPNAESPWAVQERVQAPVSYRCPEMTVWNGPQLDKVFCLLEGCFRDFY